MPGIYVWDPLENSKLTISTAKKTCTPIFSRTFFGWPAFLFYALSDGSTCAFLLTDSRCSLCSAAVRGLGFGNPKYFRNFAQYSMWPLSVLSTPMTCSLSTACQYPSICPSTAPTGIIQATNGKW